MEFAVGEQITRVSRRIRGWREDDDLTLQELAELSGLATSTVQKVETGQMMPSLAVLLKLAHGLGRPISEMLADAGAETDVFYSRACERKPLRIGGAVAAERLSGDLLKSTLETWQVTLEPGASSGSDPMQYEGEELVVCGEGLVRFRIGDEEYLLRAGDSLHFRACIPHSWHNDGSVPTRFTITSSLPLVFRSLMHSRVPNPSVDVEELLSLSA